MRRPLIALLCAVPSLAHAAEPTRRFEIFAGVTLVDPRLDAGYTTRFAPTLGTGAGGQSLRVRGESGQGAELGIGFFPGRRLGARLTAGHTALDLGGANSPYAWRTRVTERQPPDYQPREFDFTETTAWPDTTGRLKVLTLSLDGVVRWGEGRRVHGSVSGGLSALRVSADLAPVGYTTFHLGGHSTFFPQEYVLGLTLETRSTLGLNLGADVEVALGRTLGLRLGCALVRARSVDATVVELQIRSPDQVYLSTPIEQIQANLMPPALALDASATRLVVALVLRP
jgi:hypothetical protein